MEVKDHQIQTETVEPTIHQQGVHVHYYGAATY